MAISIEKKAIGLVLGLLGAFALYAALAPAAKATQVTPTSTQIELNLNPNTTSDFHPTNAYASIWIECENSRAYFTIPSGASPPDNNKNQPGVGNHSNDHGSVGVPLDSNPNDDENDRVATFSRCTVEHETFGTVNSAEVRTNDDHGAWSVSAHASDTRDPMVAIGVPMDGAVIGVPDLMDPDDCEITVSHHADTFGMASAVMGEWDNPPAGRNDTGRARIDEQLHFIQTGPSCSGSSPAQYEAVYEPQSNAVTVAP